MKLTLRSGLNAALAGLLIPLSAMAQEKSPRTRSGGGYNGPVTAGTSIPVELDRAVTLDALTRTYQVCVGRIATSLARQVVKMTPAEFENEYREEAELHDPQWSFDQRDGFSANFYRFSGEKFHPQNQNRPDFYMMISLSAHYNEKYPEAASADLTDFRIIGSIPGSKLSDTAFNFPHIPLAVFKNTLNQSKYDQFGNVDNSTVILDGLELKIPRDYQDKVRLINRNSSVASELEVNLGDYISCFYEEIQK